MSLPYFCTRCGRNHVRGAIYKDHQEYNQTAANDAKVDAYSPDNYDPRISRNIDVDHVGLHPDGSYGLGYSKTDENVMPAIARIMEVETPTKEEILAAVDVACKEAAIPEGITTFPAMTTPRVNPFLARIRAKMDTIRHKHAKKAALPCTEAQANALKSNLHVHDIPLTKALKKH